MITLEQINIKHAELIYAQRKANDLDKLIRSAANRNIQVVIRDISNITPPNEYSLKESQETIIILWAEYIRRVNVLKDWFLNAGISVTTQDEDDGA